MKTYIILLLLSFCKLGHTVGISDLPSGIGNLKETKGDRVAVQPLEKSFESLQFNEYAVPVMAIIEFFAPEDVINFPFVCKKWRNITKAAKNDHEYLIAAGLKLPGKNFFAIYFNEDSSRILGFTSTELRHFVCERYLCRKISERIVMPETPFSGVSGNFAQRLVKAIRILDGIKKNSKEIDAMEKVHCKLGALAYEVFGADFNAGIKSDSSDLIRGLHDLLQSTKFSTVLGVRTLTESQTVCYELLKSLKSYLVFKRTSCFWKLDSYYPEQALIFNFLKGPDFPSNFIATKEEVSPQIKQALGLTEALIKKRREAEVVDKLVAVRNALLA